MYREVQRRRTGKVRAPHSTIQRAGPGQQGRPQNQSSPAGCCSPAAPCARLPPCCTLLRHVVVDQCSSGGVGSAWCLPLTPPSQSWQTTPPAFLHSDTLSAPVSSLKNLIRRWPSTSSSCWQAAFPPSRHKVGSTVSTSNEEFPQELFLAASRDNVRPSTLHTMQWSEPMVKPQKKKKMQ